MPSHRNHKRQTSKAKKSSKGAGKSRLPPPGTTVSSPDDEPMVVHPDRDTEHDLIDIDDDDEIETDDEGADRKGIER